MTGIRKGCLGILGFGGKTMTVVQNAPPAVIRIFLDESGDDVSYALAGLIGAEENWKGFADEWTAVMEKYGLKGTALHMRELQGSKEEPWVSLRNDPAKANALLDELAEVIIAHKIAAFGAVLLMDEYKALDAAAKKRWPNPYKLCFETAVIGADEACDPAAGGKIYLVFDNGCNEGWAKQAYKKLKAKASTTAFADEAKFEDDTKWPELCAADWVAYELRRAFYNYHVKKQNDLRPAFQKLVLKTVYIWWKVEFDNVIDQAKVIPFTGTKESVAQIFLYQDDPRP
jgi:hypothetical protein